jgi:purine-nucleoside phosphorylase
MKADFSQTAAWLKDKLQSQPVAGLILGTGLSSFTDDMEVLATIPYSEVPGFVESTAPSHRGNVVLALLNGKPVLVMQGRFHFYEGHPMHAVVFPTRVMSRMGIPNLIVTNAAGSLRKELAPGALVQIYDHINHMGTNPLIGANIEELGERFPSMNLAYDPIFIRRCQEIAKAEDITLHQGIYLAVTGPSLETKAECAAFASWGADLVGMSTVPEVIAARHAGMRVAAFSIVTNYSNLFHDDQHSQAEIQANAAKSSVHLKTILHHLVSEL